MDTKNKFLTDDNFIKWRLFKTEALDRFWTDYITNNPHLEEELKTAIEYFDSVKLNDLILPESQKTFLYRTLQNKIEKQNRRKSLLLSLSSIAAILIIALAVNLYFNQYRNNIVVPQSDIILGKALPEEEVYIISGNQKINLANNSTLELISEKVVIKDSTSTTTEVDLTVAKLNKLVVPFGKRSKLTLADGSKVWVNSGTILSFPSQFKNDKREISVDGEIYIEVKKNLDVPFIIRSGEMNIHVTGTSFNVSAYKEDDIKSVVLVEGKVNVESGKIIKEMLPSEKLEYSNGTMKKEIVDVTEYISWTRDYLEFHETPVSEILKKIGRYYNVHFDNNAEIFLNNKTCSGKLYLSNNLDSVMTGISFITSTNYNRDKNLIQITNKQ